MCAERVGGAAEGMRRETRLARPGGARGPAEGAGEGGERHVGRGGAVRMGGRRGRGRAVRTPDPSEGRGGAGRVEVEALEMRSEIFSGSVVMRSGGGKRRGGEWPWVGRK